MKLRIEPVFFKSLLGFAAFFVAIPTVVFTLDRNFSFLVISWLFLGLLLFWFILLKKRSYEIEGNMLIIKSFYFRKKAFYDLEEIMAIDKKVVDLPRYPFNPTRLFSNDPKFKTFRILEIEFNDNRKLKIDERLIMTEDFKKFYQKIESLKK